MVLEDLFDVSVDLPGGQARLIAAYHTPERMPELAETRGRAARIRVHLGPLFMPGFVFDRPERQRALVPLLNEIPIGGLGGRLHPSARHLDALALCAVRARIAEALDDNGHTIGVELDWPRLAAQAGFPRERLDETSACGRRRRDGRNSPTAGG